MREVVVGLDLSCTGTGLCRIPCAWDLRRELVQCSVRGIDLKSAATNWDRTRRLEDLADWVCRWLAWAKATRLFVEDLPTGRAFSIVQLAELRGVVRVEIRRRLGLDVTFVQADRAREFTFGRRPPPGAGKAWIVEPLKLCGLPVDNDNAADAFVIANWGLSELGAPAIANLRSSPEEEALRKERARAKARARRRTAA